MMKAGLHREMVEIQNEIRVNTIDVLSYSLLDVLHELCGAQCQSVAISVGVIHFLETSCQYRRARKSEF